MNWDGKKGSSCLNSCKSGNCSVMVNTILLFGFALLLFGCPASTVIREDPSKRGTHYTYRDETPGSLQKPKLMIFGGEGHAVYLGCLNCDSTRPDSIFNVSGRYGRCLGVSGDNLYCRGFISKFGNKRLFSDMSACSPRATDPPVIVDNDGNYYGRFSISRSLGHSDSVCSAFSPTKNIAICEIVEWVCEQ